MGHVARKSIMEHFKDLPDPRIDRTKRHLLSDIIVIVLIAVLCRAEGFNEIADFAAAREDWFAKFLELPNGIPSHDTFARVFARLDPQAFSSSFLAWTQSLSDKSDGRVIAVDGKTLCHSFQSAQKYDPIHMVSAWACDNHMVLGQMKVGDKTNEIKAIPLLLELLDLEGAIITIDAMGTQKAIANQIIEKKANYILSLKDNQPNLRADVEAYFNRLRNEQFRDHEDKKVAHTSTQSRNNDHGRLETRTCWAVECPNWVEGYKEWKNLLSIACIKSERQVNGVKSVEYRYYISSLPPQAKQIANAVRSHWGIENSLHWVLDRAFREDESRIHKDYAPQNMAVIRHAAVNLLKANPLQRSIRRKMFLASIDENYLRQLLFGVDN